MSEESLPHWRTSTRSAHRQNQDSSSNMQDSDSSTSDPSPSGSQGTNPSSSPRLEPKLEFKEEPADAEMPSVSMTSDSQMSPSISQASSSQIKDALGLAPLGPSPFTGRKRKANFSNEETETLVRDVVKHFSALYGSEALRTESTRRNQRRSQLWTQIQKHVNELGYTPRTIDDLKHKWRDLRLDVKRKITQKRTAVKVPPAPGVTPIIDTKLTPLEDLVASTIGHHCTLDGEQEGMYMEPGVPRQSIFFTCRGPSTNVPDRPQTTVTPRPTTEISIVPPLVSTSPAQVAFVHMSDDTENEEQDMDIPQKITIKPFQGPWTTLEKVCAIVPAQPEPMLTTQILIPAQPNLVTAQPEILTVKQELPSAQTEAEPGRCDSQSSVVSSPEDSLGNLTGHTEWSVNGDNPVVSMETCDEGEVRLKVENEENEGKEADGGSTSQEQVQSNWQENQDEWERQSASPRQSETAQDDSMASSASQEGEPSSGGELPPNGDCSCIPDERRGQWRTNMHRLLELEEQWDSMYHQELGIWEEERIQQRQQRDQDRELQQQLLGVLTDIRDELRQIRQERAAARLNTPVPEANGSSNSPNATVSKNPDTPVSQKPSDSKTPTGSVATTPSTQSAQVRRRGRPRIIRPSTEPASQS
ncbi:uncharacterized protein O3C94_005977 [Discoglossus pictus]